VPDGMSDTERDEIHAQADMKLQQIGLARDMHSDDDDSPLSRHSRLKA